jgi:hypothetical protein
VLHHPTKGSGVAYSWLGIMDILADVNEPYRHIGKVFGIIMVQH